MPLVEAIRAHVFAAERIHADDTTVPVLAKGKTRTGRLWTYVRDDRPFGGTAAPAAAFFYSADRGGVHPDAHLAGYAGLMQADAIIGGGWRTIGLVIGQQDCGSIDRAPPAKAPSRWHHAEQSRQ